MFDAFGLVGVLATWAVLGLLGYTIAITATRPRRIERYALPLAILAPVAVALLVPGLGAKGWTGFVVSAAVALITGALVGLTPSIVRLRAHG
jgi:hypothetical protein